MEKTLKKHELHRWDLSTLNRAGEIELELWGLWDFNFGQKMMDQTVLEPSIEILLPFASLAEAKILLQAAEQFGNPQLLLCAVACAVDGRVG